MSTPATQPVLFKQSISGKQQLYILFTGLILAIVPFAVWPSPKN